MSLRSLLCLFAALALVACTPVRGSSRDDDDDATDDDDAADDDDATDDDDDATGDDDDDVVLPEGAATLNGTWILSYWQDEDTSVEYCQQAFEWSGTADIGPNAFGATCPLCTGEIQILNVTDVTSTSLDITTPCDPVTHFQSVGLDDVGEQLTDPGQYGDLLAEQALLERTVALDAGTQLGPELTAADLDENFTDAGVQVIYFGYSEPLAGGYWELLDLASVAPPPPGAVDILPLWAYYGAAGAPAGVLDGQLGILLLWRINYGPDLPVATWNLSGSVNASFVED